MRQKCRDLHFPDRSKDPKMIHLIFKTLSDSNREMQCSDIGTSHEIQICEMFKIVASTYLDQINSFTPSWFVEDEINILKYN